MNADGEFTFFAVELWFAIFPAFLRQVLFSLYLVLGFPNFTPDFSFDLLYFTIIFILLLLFLFFAELFKWLADLQFFFYGVVTVFA